MQDETSDGRVRTEIFETKIVQAGVGSIIAFTTALISLSKVVMP